MSQQVKVYRNLQFRGVANTTDNIEGNPSYNKVIFYDDFLDITIDSAKWTATIPATADAIEIVAGANGHVELLMGNADNDTVALASQSTYYGNQNAVCEARIRIQDVDKSALFFGFGDAIAVSNGEMAIDYEGGATLASNFADAVGFLVDADKDTSSILVVGVKNNTDTAVTDSGTDWGDNEWKVLRVELADEDATFYLDGVAIGHILLTQTKTDPLCVVVHGANRETGTGKKIDVDYIKV